MGSCGAAVGDCIGVLSGRRGDFNVFKEQEKLRTAGDEEAQRMDDDFVTALKHGMPPTAGLGMGIDRLAALLTDSHNVKEVILFPTLKPKE